MSEKPLDYADEKQTPGFGYVDADSDNEGLSFTALIAEGRPSRLLWCL
jgi:hypothetical protein